mmetsp:Transcript_23748/g.53594  ORF Transcript_23748/g.53594 Transcript_23748/m.53594 type:complete len:290 (-) Transcript_23748:221-1090(-)
MFGSGKGGEGGTRMIPEQPAMLSSCSVRRVGPAARSSSARLVSLSTRATESARSETGTPGDPVPPPPIPAPFPAPLPDARLARAAGGTVVSGRRHSSESRSQSERLRTRRVSALAPTAAWTVASVSPERPPRLSSSRRPHRCARQPRSPRKSPPSELAPDRSRHRSVGPSAGCKRPAKSHAPPLWGEEEPLFKLGDDLTGLAPLRSRRSKSGLTRLTTALVDAWPLATRFERTAQAASVGRNGSQPSMMLSSSLSARSATTFVHREARVGTPRSAILRGLAGGSALSAG